MQRALRPYVTTGIAILGAGIITVAPAPAPASNAEAHAVQLLSSGADIAYIVGGSGDPIPSDHYVDFNYTHYVQPHFPGYAPQAVFTPEGNYALYTGVKSLTLDQSEAQGVTILDNTIKAHVDGQPGNHVAILGDSQSSTISSMLMPLLHEQGVSPDQVGFVLLADPNMPNGGLFERLDGVTIPSLGITFNGATPDDLYPTSIYMQAYDGFADIPRYPINFLADLNSILGIQFVHPTYQALSPEHIGDFSLLPGSAELTGEGLTNYYALPLSDETVPYLPLLQLLLDIPGVGKPLADFLQPILTPLINLGYGNPDYAWSTGPANVPTEFGLSPSFDMTLKALQESVAGIGTGFKDALTGLAAPGPADAAGLSLPSLADTLSGLETMGTALAADPASELTHIVNTLTGAFSQAYATLLPTADVATGVLVTIPNYDLQWFMDGLEAGNLLEAIGQPLANDVYLYTLAGGFETFAMISAFQTIGGELQGLF